MSHWSMGNVSLQWPVWLIPAVALFILGLTRSQQEYGGWAGVLSAPVLAFLGGTTSRPRMRWRLLTAAWVALALTSPSVRVSDASTWRHSTAWIAIVDVSRSMTLDDITPSRLAAARDAVIDLSRAAGARPMALLIYAGDAFLVSPPAFDRSLLEQHASLLEHGSVPLEGSNLARALSLASSVVSDSGVVSSRVLLLSDSAGANRNAHSAARYLAEQGHRLDVLLFASNGSNSDGAHKVDVKAARVLADEGGGTLVMADAFGTIDLAALDLERDIADDEGLLAVQWRTLSHWMLLPLLFVLPAIARRSGT